MQKLLAPIFLIVSGAFFFFTSLSSGAMPISIFGSYSCFAGIISGWIIILVSVIKWLVKAFSDSSDEAEGFPEAQNADSQD
ncbi:MAG: hypothetical protein NC319_02550 [Butyricicoccus sp.]|nr:hypothetical protein [Butyricicoccus sp.]